MMRIGRTKVGLAIALFFGILAVACSAPAVEELSFETTPSGKELQFWFDNPDSNQYLVQLRSRYALDSIVHGANSDAERASAIMHWAHNLWEHDGANTPEQNDALYILEAVRGGARFRCVEYAIAVRTCLNAIGIPARAINLKTADVETRPTGAGHVCVEFYASDLGKWVFLDPQWDAMPALDGVPLNAVEFQRAIANSYDKLEIRSLGTVLKKSYVKWIAPYLYYFDASFDCREGVGLTREKVLGKSNLMLVPLGAKEPTVFQVQFPIDWALYTHSLPDFYPAPN